MPGLLPDSAREFCVALAMSGLLICNRCKRVECSYSALLPHALEAAFTIVVWDAVHFGIDGKRRRVPPTWCCRNSRRFECLRHQHPSVRVAFCHRHQHFCTYRPTLSFAYNATVTLSRTPNRHHRTLIQQQAQSSLYLRQRLHVVSIISHLLLRQSADTPS